MVAHIVLLAGDHVDGNLSLTVSGVGQHMVTVDIADGIDTGHIGAALDIRRNTAIDFNTNVLQTQIHAVCTAADGQQYLISGNGQLLTLGRFHPNLAGFYRQALVAQQESNTLGFCSIALISRSVGPAI